MNIPGACVHCQGAHIKLRKQRISSGALQFAWYCMDCNRWAESPPKWLPHGMLKSALEKQGHTFEDVPAINDYSDACPCCICAKPGEVHHWAPQALQKFFEPDWIIWPTACLCVEHHRLWHKVVTPQLSKRNAQ